MSVHFSSGKDDWGTPDDLFHSLNARYHFVLDAAADASNHLCPRWFGPGGEHEDALSVDWPLEEGNIWLNPPYSRGLQAKFVEKALDEHYRVLSLIYDEGEDLTCGKVVCLLPARTDTKLFHEVIMPSGEVEFLKGRLKFKGAGGVASSPAPFPSMLVVF